MSGPYPINVGFSQYHSDTIASEKLTLTWTARPGLHRRAAPLPQLDGRAHRASWPRRSCSVPTTWVAARAAQRLVRMVSIARGDSIVLQSIHLDADVLVPVHELSRSLPFLPLLLSTVDNLCA